LRYKELQVKEIPKWSGYLREQWRRHFAKHLTKEEQLSIGMDCFLWYLCSWKKVQCYTNEEAIDAFNRQQKKSCSIFYQYTDEAYLIEKAESLAIEELPYRRQHMYYGDIYIMDKEYKWTFVMTHEIACGPYFIQS
jgi:hypothetical protein